MHKHRSLTAILVFLIPLVYLSACGGGGGSGESGGPDGEADTEAPLITIEFPPSKATVEGSTILIRGASSDNKGVVRVDVNGTVATSNDNFQTWQATVPLNNGSNPLTATATDGAGNTSTGATVSIQRTVLIRQPEWLDFDSTNNRLYANDWRAQSIIEIDLATGLRSVFYRNSVLEGADPTLRPHGIALDAANTRLLVVEKLGSDSSSIIAIDTSTGAKTIISDATTPDSSNLLDNAAGIVVDTAMDVAIVTQSGELIAVDLGTGARTIFSANGVPDSTNPLFDPQGIVLDAANDRYLVVNTTGNPGVYAVDRTSGARAIISDNTTPNSDSPQFTTPTGIAFDSANSRVFIPDSGNIIEVNLTTGQRSTLINYTAVNPDVRIARGTGAVFDNTNSRILMADRNRLLAASSSGDALTSLVDNRTAATNVQLSDLAGVASGASNQPAYAVQFGFGESSTGLYEIDLDDGTTQEVSTSGDAILNPRDLTIDKSNDLAYIVTSGSQNALISVDLSTNVSTILSGPAIPDADNAWTDPRGITLDLANNRALVTEAFGAINSKAIVAVDLFTGARTVFSDATTPNTDNPIDFPNDITIDTASDRALVTDPGTLDTIFSVALSTNPGARTILSDATTPDSNNPFLFPDGIVMDTPSNRALVVDSNNRALMAVNLASGLRTIISDSSTPNPNTAFIQPIDVALDSSNNRALVLEESLDAIFAVDLETGERVLLAK